MTPAEVQAVIDTEFRAKWTKEVRKEKVANAASALLRAVEVFFYSFDMPKPVQGGSDLADVLLGRLAKYYKVPADGVLQDWKIPSAFVDAAAAQSGAEFDLELSRIMGSLSRLAPPVVGVVE